MSLNVSGLARKLTEALHIAEPAELELNQTEAGATSELKALENVTHVDFESNQKPAIEVRFDAERPQPRVATETAESLTRVQAKADGRKLPVEVELATTDTRYTTGD